MIKLFPPIQLFPSENSKLLLNKESKIYVLNKEKNENIYSNFSDQFNTYLIKLSNNNIKNYISECYKRNIIYLGMAPVSKNDPIFVRVNISNNKLYGIILLTNVLGIDISNGEAEDISDSIYASYFGLIRAASYIFQDDIKKNKELHQLLSNYIYRVILNSIPKGSIYSDKQKNYINMACIYMYYRHYLKYKHSESLMMLRKDYNTFFEKEDLDYFYDLILPINTFDTIKEIGKLLVILKIINNSDQLIINLITIFGNKSVLFLLGSLDYLISLVCISLYPTNLINSSSMINEKICSNIENIMISYINKIEYANSI